MRVRFAVTVFRLDRSRATFLAGTLAQRDAAHITVETATAGPAFFRPDFHLGASELIRALHERVGILQDVVENTSAPDASTLTGIALPLFRGTA